MMSKIRNEKHGWNHKRVYRIYCDLDLNIRVKPKKRLAAGIAVPLLQPIKENVFWSMDFMSDALRCGRRFRTFNVLDDYNREALRVEPSFSFPSLRVTQILEELIDVRGCPDVIRCDNGPEFRSKIFREWAKKTGLKVLFIQPGKPAQNGFVERFNRTCREDVLDSYLFDNLREVKIIIDEWLKSYNQERPHQSLGGLSPRDFANRTLGVDRQNNSNLMMKGECSTFNLS